MLLLNAVLTVEQANAGSHANRGWETFTDAAIDAPLPPGDDVPGVKAFRTAKGVAIKPVTATIEIAGVKAAAEVRPGAKEVVFVERSRNAVSTLRKNIELLEATGAIVQEGDARAYLASAGEAGFDVVFLDPPFADESMSELCRLIDEQGVLASGARVYLEQARSAPNPELPAGWQISKDKAAGNVRYTLVETPRD